MSLWQLMASCGGSEDALRQTCLDLTAEQLIVLHRLFGDMVDQLADRHDPFPIPDPAPEQRAHFAEVAAETYRRRFGVGPDSRRFGTGPDSPAPDPAAAWEDFELTATSLQELCEQLTREQLVLFHQRFTTGSPTRRQAEVAVARGRGVWHDALYDVDDLPGPDGPGFAAVMAGVYRERFGGDIPRLEPAPTAVDTGPQWKEDVQDLLVAVSVGMPLWEGLSGRTRAELVNLYAALGTVLDDLATRAEAAFGKDPATSDWHLWADWVIRQGRDEYEQQLSDRAPQPVPDDATFVSEDFFEWYKALYGAAPRVG